METAGANDKESPTCRRSRLAGALYYVTLADVVADPSKVDTGLDKPVTIRAETFDGSSYTLRIGNKDKDRYYVGVSVAGELAKPERTPEGREARRRRPRRTRNSPSTARRLRRTSSARKLVQWTYLVPASALAPLLRERAQLLAELQKKDENKDEKKVGKKR